MLSRFFLLPLLYLSAQLGAQSDMILLNGKIFDGISETPIPYATLLVHSTNDTFIDGTTTNERGVFSLKLAKGEYLIKLSSIGYQNTQKDIVVKESRQLDFRLERMTQMLETVEIVEERTSVEQLIDRKVINVGKDLQAGGGDALELLSQLAEVQTNPSGSVELRGSGNIQILVNGKPSPLAPQDLLQQIDAAFIQKIELITTPSAKYQADGLSGIINIITQQKKERGFIAALNGSINNNPHYRSGLTLSQGSKHLNLKVQTIYGNSQNDSRSQRSRLSETFQYDQNSQRQFDGEVKTLMGGLDWFLDDKNEFSMSAHFTDNSHLINNVATINETTRSYEFRALNEHAHLIAEYNLNYRRTFKQKGHYLEADFHLSDNNNDLLAKFDQPDGQSSSFLDYHTKISQTSLDYVLPLKAKNATLESGLIYTLKSVNNQRSFNTEIDERFGFEEKTIGAYGLFRKSGAKWKLQLGLRYEGFWSESAFEQSEQNFSQGFHNLFPSTHFSYTFNDYINTNLAYNRRTSRPGLWHINPFANAFDPFFNRQGNPALKPEFSHNLEWNTSFNKKSWSLIPSLFFRHKTDLIVPVYKQDNNGLVLQSFDNRGSSQAYGAELAFSYSPFSFLRTSLNGNFYWENIQSEENNGLGSVQLKRHNTTLKNLFQLSKKVRLDLTWIYRGRGIYRFSKSLASNKIDLAMQFKILKGKGSLNARLTDIFNTFQSESILFGEGFEERNFRKWPTRIASLSFNIKFANSQNLRSRNRKKRSLDTAGSLE